MTLSICWSFPFMLTAFVGGESTKYLKCEVSTFLPFYIITHTMCDNFKYYKITFYTFAHLKRDLTMLK